MNTGLIKSDASLIYAKIDNPMQAVVDLGKLLHASAIMGITTPGDGAVVALTCMCEGITPLEFAKTYHIINGRPSMRADMMAAKFRAAGGKIDWKSIGDDGKAAEATFTYDGQSLSTKYTIEDARCVVGDKLDKPDSNWRKDRGAMLRARLITKAIRILAPELIAGVYTPEELADAGVVQVQSVRSEAEIAERRRELLQEPAEPITVTSTAAVADPIIEAVIETPPFATEPEPAVTATPASDDDEKASNKELQELVALATKLDHPTTPGTKMTVAQVAEMVCKAAKVEKPQHCTKKQVKTLVDRIRAQLAKVS